MAAASHLSFQYHEAGRERPLFDLLFRGPTVPGLGAWELPFGRTKKWGKGMNRFLDAVTGG